MVVDKGKFMQFNLSRVIGKNKHYEILGEISIKQFTVLIDLLSKSFVAVPKLTSIPEAEIAVFKISSAQIYAKYDLVYGLEIDCAGLTNAQYTRLEHILSVQ